MRDWNDEFANSAHIPGSEKLPAIWAARAADYRRKVMVEEDIPYGPLPRQKLDLVRPDGQLTFQDSGSAPGRKVLSVTVSDGQATSEGKITVDVRTPGALPPIANADQPVTGRHFSCPT